MNIQLLEYIPDSNDDYSKKLLPIPFNENIIAAAKLSVNSHNQLEISSVKILQLEFLSQDLNKYWLAR